MVPGEKWPLARGGRSVVEVEIIGSVGRRDDVVASWVREAGLHCGIC